MNSENKKANALCPTCARVRALQVRPPPRNTPRIYVLAERRQSAATPALARLIASLVGGARRPDALLRCKRPQRPVFELVEGSSVWCTAHLVLAARERPVQHLAHRGDLVSCLLGAKSAASQNSGKVEGGSAADIREPLADENLIDLYDT